MSKVYKSPRANRQINSKRTATNGNAIAAEIEKLRQEVAQLRAENLALRQQLGEIANKPITDLTPLERIMARVEAEESERQALLQQYGDPLKALDNILADVPKELLEKDIEEDADGNTYINWRKG